MTNWIELIKIIFTVEKNLVENVNCEISLSRNEAFLGLLTSVFSYTPMQSRYKNITSLVLMSLNEFVRPNV